MICGTLGPGIAVGEIATGGVVGTGILAGADDSPGTSV
jgi:hypothetical protein